ncbi:hypothetical protein GCM10023094_54990 [Rhodococcus olei]|uniref:Uncharacterized protein n=1 Tax=Rhodococcus olei TaxID=2161675 RepID=A0ABP8PTQ1_9NOCA
MTIPIASDREGREWALLAVHGALRCRLVSGTATPAVMDLTDLVDVYGPLTMSSTRPAVTGGFATLIDTVDLVAADPETATVEQIDQVAAFAKSIVQPTNRA